MLQGSCPYQLRDTNRSVAGGGAWHRLGPPRMKMLLQEGDVEDGLDHAVHVAAAEAHAAEAGLELVSATGED